MKNDKSTTGYRKSLEGTVPNCLSKKNKVEDLQSLILQDGNYFVFKSGKNIKTRKEEEFYCSYYENIMFVPSDVPLSTNGAWPKACKTFPLEHADLHEFAAPQYPLASFDNYKDILFFGSTMWDENYGHWVWDTLPRIWMYLELRKKIPNLKLFLQAKHRSTEWQIEAYGALGIPEEDIIVYEPHNGNQLAAYLADRIIMPSHGIRDLPASGQTSVEVISLMDAMIERCIELQPRDKTYPEKIYSSRRDTKGAWKSPHGRTLINEDEIVRFLEARGFQEVVSSQMSFVDKVLTYYYAKEVVGPVGANMMNTFFSRNASIYLLQSPLLKTFWHLDFAFCFGNNLIFMDESSMVESDHPLKDPAEGSKNLPYNDPWKYSMSHLEETFDA